MKRRIRVRSDRITIEATIDSKQDLTRDEVETVRDELADELQRVAADVRWLGSPRHKVRVV